MKSAQFVLTYKKEEAALEEKRDLGESILQSLKSFISSWIILFVLKRKSLEISIVYSHLSVSFKLKLSSTFTYSS